MHLTAPHIGTVHTLHAATVARSASDQYRGRSTAQTSMGTSWLNFMLTFPLSVHFFRTILQYSHYHIRFLSHCLHIPRTHCHLLFLVPTLSLSLARSLLSLCSHKSFPCALLHTRLVRSNYGRAAQPPAHTLCTHSPLSLSLYQLGINLLKQRAS